MTGYVIDASVAIKWVITEPGSDEALALRSHGRLAAPDLLVVECANILWKKVRRGELDADAAAVAAQLLRRADIELVPMRHLIGPSIVLAIELDHPAYDCAYLALADEQHWPFVTADERLVRKVIRDRRRSPLSAPVLSLAEAAAGRS